MAKTNCKLMVRRRPTHLRFSLSSGGWSSPYGIRSHGRRGRRGARCRTHRGLCRRLVLEASNTHRIRALVRRELPVEGEGPVRVLRARGVEGEVLDERQIARL